MCLHTHLALLETVAVKLEALGLHAGIVRSRPELLLKRKNPFHVLSFILGESPQAARAPGKVTSL